VNNRPHAREQGGDRADALALLQVQPASQHADAAFRLARATLTDFAERVEADGTGPAQLERLRRLIALKVKETAVLQNLSLTNETGVVIVDGGAMTPPVDLSDREYFQYHRVHSDAAPHIGAVVRSKLTDKWIIPISRRVNHADGSFAGVAATSIEVN
jgi:two-component system sensor histidine kinase/response regulator